MVEASASAEYAVGQCFRAVLLFPFYYDEHLLCFGKLELPTETQVFDEKTWLFLILPFFLFRSWIRCTRWMINSPARSSSLPAARIELFSPASCMMKRHWAPKSHEQTRHFCDRPRKPRPLITVPHFVDVGYRASSPVWLTRRLCLQIPLPMVVRA